MISTLEYLSHGHGNQLLILLTTLWINVVDELSENESGKKKLRIQKYPDMCGPGLSTMLREKKTSHQIL